MNAFVTGSRAYGTIKPDSDIDLVIRIDHETAILLRKLSDQSMEVGEKNTPRPVRFGKLNLLLCESDEEWAVWRIGTTQMRLDIAAFDKAAAKKNFDVLRNLCGLADKADSEKKK